MSKAQRNKGANGERELFKLLSEHLGVAISRNLQQSRNGGADSVDLAPFALEVKRQETLALGAWWNQAVSQVTSDRPIPVLAYRQSRQPWRFVLPMGVLTGCDRPLTLEWCVTCPLEVFAEIARERLA